MVSLAIGRDSILSISNVNSTKLWRILSGLDDTWVAIWEHAEESLLSISRPGEGNGGGDLAGKVISQVSLDTGQ